MQKPRNFNLEKVDLKGSFDFTCVNCGSCCTRLKIALSIFDIARIADSLELSIPDFREKYIYEEHRGDQNIYPVFYLKDIRLGLCSFRKNKKCSIYELRPLSCRLFPLGIRDGGLEVCGQNFCYGRVAPKEYLTLEYLQDMEVEQYLKEYIYHGEIQRGLNNHFLKVDSKDFDLLLMSIYLKDKMWNRDTLVPTEGTYQNFQDILRAIDLSKTEFNQVIQDEINGYLNYIMENKENFSENSSRKENN